MPEKTRQEMLDILEAWEMLDFLDQTSLAKEHKPKRNGRKKERANFRFEPFGFDLSESVASYCINHAIATRKKNHWPQHKVCSDIALHIGHVPRSLVIENLAHLLPELKDTDVVDKNTDYISAILLKISSDGSLSDIEISPLLWAFEQACKAGSLNADKFPIQKYQQLKKQALDTYEEKEDPLTWKDIEKIRQKYVKPLLSSLDFTRQKETEEECQSYNLLDFSSYDTTYVTSTENNESLSLTFFADDIKAVRDAVKACPFNDLPETPLKLATEYIAGKSYEDKSAGVDMRGSDTDELMDFYSTLLDPNNTPLGKWPSKYPLALMQQSAVNMAAGRMWRAESSSDGGSHGPYPANDIVSVNGPPGTGKTTLLKDIIAANVVEKARLLSVYDNPDDAFEKVSYEHAKQQTGSSYYLPWAKDIYRFKNDRINDFGILVCSSNNAAVENISKELPDGDGLVGGVKPSGSVTKSDKYTLQDVYRAFNGTLLEDVTFDWGTPKEPDIWRDTYFSRAARRQFTEHKRENPPEDKGTPWALLAARLGRGSNISNFRDELNSIYWLIQHQTKGDNKDKTLHRYLKTRNKFLRLYKDIAEKDFPLQAENFSNYKKLQNDLKEIQQVKFEQDNAQKEALQCIDHISQIEDQAIQQAKDYCFDIGEEENAPLSWKETKKFWDSYSNQIHMLEFDLIKAQARVHRSQKEKDRLIHKFIGKNKAEEDLSSAQKEYDKLQHDLVKYHEVQHYISEWNNLSNQRSALHKKAEEAHERLNEIAAFHKNLQREIDELRARVHATSGEGETKRYLYPTKEFAESFQSESTVDKTCAQLSNPTSNSDLDRKRELLFFYALQLTRDFILASKYFASNFINLYALWGGKVKIDGEKKRIQFHPDDRKFAMPILLQSLMVLTPVVSSTFASVGHMLADVPITANEGAKAPFGTLVIDEAGQALPMMALGALARCRRAVIVGDPLQIAPVVTDDLSILRNAWTDRVGFEYVGKNASVQGLADKRNPYGGYITDAETGEEQWLGCPLVIHRRCISPMFDISNEVSYSGTMIKQTADPSSKLQFVYPSSRWINIAGAEKGNKDHYVVAQGDCAIDIITDAFCAMNGKDIPNLYVISPFTSVVRGFKKAMNAVKDRIPNVIDHDDWKKFIKYNIGTVHTFQGKEANEVIFLLGCDRTKGARGAIGWVPANIVNVAASRAKYRFYTIGDASAWVANPSIATMKKILDTQWIPHYKKWKESKENDALEENIEELQEAQRLLPPGESIPGVDAEDPNKPEELDTSDYLKNIDDPQLWNTIQTMEIDDAQCKNFDFNSADELAKAFDDCVDEKGNNRVLQNIQQGIFLYNLFDISPVENDNETIDYKFCAVMFCCACEIYLNTKLLPLLKKVDGTYELGRPGGKPRYLKDQKSLTIGTYPDIIKAEAAKLAHYSPHQYSEKWWRDFANRIENFKNNRNDVSHGDPIKASKVNRICERLFGAPVMPDDPQPQQPPFILRAKAAFSGEVDTEPQIEPQTEPGIEWLTDVERPQTEAGAQSQTESDTQSKAEVDKNPQAEPQVEVERPKEFDLSIAQVKPNFGYAATTIIGQEMHGSNKYFKRYFAMELNRTRKLFDVLTEKGYIVSDQNRNRFPTQKGFDVGIRWAHYDDGGAGIRFNDKGWQFLIQFVKQLVQNS